MKPVKKTWTHQTTKLLAENNAPIIAFSAREKCGSAPRCRILRCGHEKRVRHPS